jgi:hypothetical protein
MADSDNSAQRRAAEAVENIHAFTSLLIFIR